MTKYFNIILTQWTASTHLKYSWIYDKISETLYFKVPRRICIDLHKISKLLTRTECSLPQRYRKNHLETLLLQIKIWMNTNRRSFARAIPKLHIKSVPNTLKKKLWYSECRQCYEVLLFSKKRVSHCRINQSQRIQNSKQHILPERKISNCGIGCFYNILYKPLQYMKMSRYTPKILERCLGGIQRWID